VLWSSVTDAHTPRSDPRAALRLQALTHHARAALMNQQPTNWASLLP